MMRNIRIAAFILAVALASGVTVRSAARQTPSQDGVIRINVNRVQVDAVVTDSKGKPVTDLRADDFEILQDGKPQPITNFAYINVKNRSADFTPRIVAVQPKNGPPAPPPPPRALRQDQIRRTIAIVVDDLGLSFESMVRVRDAAKKWVDTEMQPGDLVAVIRTSAGMGALQQFTSDKRLLNAAIDRVQYHLGRVGISSFGPIAAETSTIDTSAFDEEVRQSYLLGSLGAIQYVVQGLREMPGRKNVILFSESMELTFQQGNNLVNTRTMTQLTNEDRMRRLADAANRSSVVISAVDPRGVVYTGPTAEDNLSRMSPQQIGQVSSQRSQQLIASQDGMVMLSQKTGGLFLQNTNDISAALRQAIDDGDGYYLLAYQPDQSTFDEKAGTRFHSINVRVKRPGLRVRSRTGFYGTPDSERAPVPETKQQQLVKALISPFSTGSLRVHLTTLFSNSEKQGSYINVMLHIDTHDLAFKQEADGSRSDLLDVAAVTFDAEGHQVDGVDRTYRFQFPEKDYDRILRNGLVYSAHVPIRKSGPYQMRVVLRDDTNQQLGSATQFIDVPDVTKDRLILSGLLLAADQPQASSAESPAEGVVDSDDPNGTPAVRIFKPGASVIYAYQILNAHADHDKKPQLEGHLRLFRDGQQVFASMPSPVSADKQLNPRRLIAAGRLQLTQIPPGQYVLQIIIADKLRKEKDRIAAQSMDFEIRQ
jgi:VWFA-related protein